MTICEHIHDNGSTCGSPALTGYSFCFFHQRLRHPRHRPGDFEYKLPILDTPHAILMATQHITQAALDGILEPSRARLVLSALRLAKAILKEMSQGDVEKGTTNVGTGALARAARAQLAVSAAPAATEALTNNSHQKDDLLDADPTPDVKNSTSDATTPNTSTKKPPQSAPLSATQLKLMKKILRRGPSDPRFAAAARVLDTQISRGKTE